tara:strand:+ start:413 stop:856 length:444 start_codon:yes stop_codon:yes gene_type:complete
MNIKLTWEDLIVDSFDQEEAESWLSNWDGILSGQLSPLFMTKFGDWFLRRPNGTTEMLDIIDGNLSVVAQTPEEFQQFMNDPAWQEEFLLSLVVYGFHEKGIIPRDGQCYGFAPHPALVGEIDNDTVMLMDIAVWQSICAQTLTSNA